MKRIYSELASGMMFKYVGSRGFYLKPGDVIILKDILSDVYSTGPAFTITRESDGLDLFYVEDAANGYKFNEDFVPMK